MKYSNLGLIPTLSIYLSISIHVSIYLVSIYLSIYLSIHQFISVHVSIYHLSIYLSIYLSIHLSIYLSIYPCIYLSIYLSISHSILSRLFTRGELFRVTNVTSLVGPIAWQVMGAVAPQRNLMFVFWSVGRVCWSACHSFLKVLEVTLRC